MSKINGAHHKSLKSEIKLLIEILMTHRKLESDWLGFHVICSQLNVEMNESTFVANLTFANFLAYTDP